MRNAYLSIVVGNPEPHREQCYPRIWLLYSREQDSVKVHIGRDDKGRPHVVEKTAA